MHQLIASVQIYAPIEIVWRYLVTPAKIVKWHFADDSWQCAYAENTLEVGGDFVFHMKPKDSNEGFDFAGKYDTITPHKKLKFHLTDNRKVEIDLEEIDGITIITEKFEPESESPIYIQQKGWEAMLQNLKRIIEKEINK